MFLNAFLFLAIKYKKKPNTMELKEMEIGETLSKKREF
jgi:hypothetical protein